MGELAVVGAGPAGLAAGIQAHRMGLEVLVLERDRPGGALRAAFHVENYPGFPGGLPGKTLADRMARQAQALGVPFHEAEVLRILPAEGGFLLETSGEKVRARAVIAATGSRPRKLGIPGEDDLLGSLIFHRATQLLGSSLPGKVLVVGGGDAAFDQAALLASRGVEVLLAHRSPRPRALPRIISTACSLGVRVLPGARLLSLEREGDGLVASLLDSEGRKTAGVDALLPAVGKEPDFSLLPPEALHPGGGLPVDGRGRTGVPGLFAAGDLRRGLDRQAVIAAGDGMAAVLEAARFLEECRHV